MRALLFVIAAVSAFSQTQPSGCESSKCHQGIEPMHTSLAMKDRVKCIEAGCTDYLAKPITRSQLLRGVSQYIGSPVPDGEEEPAAVRK